MEASLRTAFNTAYSPDFYPAYLGRLEAQVGHKIPFRVAETPLFMPPGLRGHMEGAAKEIVGQLSKRSLIDQMKRAIPAHLDAPGMDHLPNCAQVDFAITRAPNGELEGRVVELQAFPSLYALMVLQLAAISSTLSSMPGLDKRWSIYFSGHDHDSFVAKLRRALLGGEEPESVVLVDLNPPNQKTYPDFLATKQLTGIDAVCPTSLIREGNKLFRRVGGRTGRLVQVKRMFNRLVFDEIEQKKVELPFAFTDELEVTWCSHPNWYWTWSKYSLPYLDHPAVPRARYVADLERIPDDLERYVLKPLFSFAGSGVNIEPTRADIEAIPEEQRRSWLLQEKITYEPALKMPTGEGVKAEVRMMFLRAPDEAEPELVLNLVRLSRGKMLGVDQNRDMTWVGGSIGIWPVE